MNNINHSDFELDGLGSLEGEHEPHVEPHHTPEMDINGLPSFAEGEGEHSWDEHGVEFAAEGGEHEHGHEHEHEVGDEAEVTEPKVGANKKKLLIQAGIGAVAVGFLGFVALPMFRGHSPAPAPQSAVHNPYSPSVHPSFAGVDNMPRPHRIVHLAGAGVVGAGIGVAAERAANPAPSEDTAPVSVVFPQGDAPKRLAPVATAAPEAAPVEAAAPAPAALPAPIAAPVAAPAAAPAADSATEAKLADVLTQLAGTMKDMHNSIDETRAAVDSTKSALLQRLDETDQHVKTIGTDETALATRVDAIETRLHMLTPAAKAATPAVATKPTHTHHHTHHAAHAAAAADIGAYKLRGVSRTQAIIDGPNGFVRVTIGDVARDAAGNAIPGIGEVKSLDQEGDAWVLRTAGGDIR